ncbi:low-specificity L-threonine aldolase [Legionella sp. MW5194]|uniref:low-specificity L-threonine aldolase n=1 Tax=Legionella sp. MW5194 TaxID=2662448 RepID=UPI00193EA347|nr:low-specificity L-threonine aldolase [Legionella sp. MW5194]QRN02768.1 low-specificity L-threonine aldolase [Legionella sp. MW5194]
MKRIDFRSDTVTQPTAGMMKAMMGAESGDDVFGEDPTVKMLESILAERAAMEAAVFAPSGTQTNLMAIMAHCERGDEYIVGQTAHTYVWEGGGAAVLGSVQPQPLDFETDGTLSLSKVALVIKPVEDHHPRSRLLCLENTLSGKALPLDYLKTIPSFCREHGLSAHLDGARVFNAVVHSGVELHEISRHFDSISICLSKGLGAPVGSVLCGSRELIGKARRWRKVLGGGMRQAGLLAAAGIYALEHHVARLQEDHDHALLLAEQLAGIESIQVESVATNVLFVKAAKNYPQLQAHLQSQGIVWPKNPNKSGQLRLVTHLDIDRDGIERTIQEVKKFYTQSRS